MSTAPLLATAESCKATMKSAPRQILKVPNLAPPCTLLAPSYWLFYICSTSCSYHTKEVNFTVDMQNLLVIIINFAYEGPQTVADGTAVVPRIGMSLVYMSTGSYKLTHLTAVQGLLHTAVPHVEPQHGCHCMASAAGDKSPPGKSPFRRLGSMKTRSVELPRRQRSTSTTGLSPQTSTGSQGLNPQPTLPQPPLQPQGTGVMSLPNQMGLNSASSLPQSGSGLMQTSSGAWTGAGGPGPRCPQPATPPQQQPAAGGSTQEQVCFQL